MPPGSWQLGLATGLAGALVGMMTLRSVRFLFGLGRGKEGLGIGDADVMMMAGAFLGWQPTVLAFFVGVFVALFFGVAQLIRKGDQALAFAPALAVGVMLTLLIWPTVSRSPNVFFLFSEGWLLGGVVAAGAVLFLMASFMLRLVRGPEPVEAVESQEKEGRGDAT
jgi:leader peptidase (prepilin peptidase)/N-methyltransferase